MMILQNKAQKLLSSEEICHMAFLRCLYETDLSSAKYHV